jgi:hypothetical protein
VFHQQADSTGVKSRPITQHQEDNVTSTHLRDLAQLGVKMRQHPQVVCQVHQFPRQLQYQHSTSGQVYVQKENQLLHQTNCKYRPNHYKLAKCYAGMCCQSRSVNPVFISLARQSFRIFECTCTRAPESLDSRCAHGPKVLGAEGLGCNFRTIAPSVYF